MRSRRFSPGSLPALHGAFLTQRAVKGSRDLEKGRGAHVEGDQRVGIARVCERKVEEVADELESMRLGAAAGTVRDGFCRDACLHGIPA